MGDDFKVVGLADGLLNGIAHQLVVHAVISLYQATETVLAVPHQAVEIITVDLAEYHANVVVVSGADVEAEAVVTQGTAGVLGQVGMHVKPAAKLLH